MANNASFKICSKNVNGIGNFTKRKDVLNYLREQRYDIYFLQETHLLTETENHLRASWGYNVWLAGATTNTNGVAILFSPTFEYKLYDTRRDPNGCYIALDIELLNKRLTIINIYGPSDRDTPEFIDKIAKVIKDIGNDDIIIGGDWNCILDMKLDSRNYTNTNPRPRTRNKIKEFMLENNLIDIFRDLYPNKKAFSWRRFNTSKQGRLDYFFISENLFGNIKDCKICPGYRSDHSIITLEMRKNEFKRDRQFWKFNNSLLNDKVYVQSIKELINNIKGQYALPIYNLENLDLIPLEEIIFTISDQLFFETLLMEIRGKTIAYSSFKKRKEREAENKLMENIDNLEKDADNIDNNINKLENLKNELELLRIKKVEGLIVRSKAQWISQGEKATRYFCNLEKRNFLNKTVGFLDRGNGVIISEQETILNEVQNFYKNLYSNNPVQDLDLDFLKNGAVLLDQSATADLEGAVTTQEVEQALISMKNDKSPGPDGFTSEFYKKFFPDIGIFLVRSLNEGFNKGELSITQYQGVITCIPKEGKPKQFIKNWRPISLLNVSYKLLSACLARRIKRVLPLIIHDSQKGFMKGRYIGENIRLLYDTILLTEKENIPGLLLMIDFEKAFDSVSWVFIEKALKFFNFPNNIIVWFKIMYKNANSCVSFNGQYSSWFKLYRGCRQGDPISPYLYLICAEILSLMIRQNKRIKGITLREKEVLLSLFADDTTLFLDGSEESFTEAIKMLDTFSKISGLKVNNDKTQIAWIGSSRKSNVRYMRDKNFIWDPGSFKVLGIHFSVNTNDIANINFEGKIEEVKREISRWNKRNMTPLGKITIIKTLVISKLTHLFMNMPDPSTRFLKELEEIIFTFLWGSKTHKVKKSTMCQPYEYGGYKMVDLYTFISTLKISWLRRIYDIEGQSSTWANLYPNLSKLPLFGLGYAHLCLSGIDNPFWIDVLKHYIKLCKVNRKLPLMTTNIYEEPIHFNVNIRRSRKVIHDKEWESLGILKVKHIINDEGKPLSFNDFKNRYNTVNTNARFYTGISNAINKYLENVKNDNYNVKFVLISDVWACIESGNKSVKEMFQNDHDLPTASIKWNAEFRNLNWKAIFIHSMKTSTDPQLKWFQARIIHRILPTKKYLHLCKLTHSPLCVFCNNNVETLNHLFWDCNFVQSFWKDLVKKLQEKCTHCDRLNLCQELILFGTTELIYTDKAIDSILLYAKYFVYKCKLQERRPQLDHFISELKHRIIVEKALSYRIGKLNVFNDKWRLYSEMVDGDIV